MISFKYSLSMLNNSTSFLKLWQNVRKKQTKNELINNSKKLKKPAKKPFILFIIWGLAVTDQYWFDSVPTVLKECGELFIIYHEETGREGPRDNILPSKIHLSVTYFLHLGSSYLPVTNSTMTSSSNQPTRRIQLHLHIH